MQHVRGKGIHCPRTSHTTRWSEAGALQGTHREFTEQVGKNAEVDSYLPSTDHGARSLADCMFSPDSG